MTKEFVLYEQALALKELGFDEPCFAIHSINLMTENEDWELKIGGIWTNHELVDSIKAPTFSQAFKWFREEYNLVHEISWSKYKGGLNFDYDVFSLVLPTDDELGDEDDIASDKSMETYDSLVDKDFRHHESNTYEEAELACLIKLIEIIKTK